MTAPRFLYLPLCSVDPASPTGCTVHWHVQNDGRCRKPGKCPASKWKDLDRWSPARPEGNAAVRTGPEVGLLVIDVDSPAAQATYARWGLPATFTVRTGRPEDEEGHHYYFRWPEGLVACPDELDGIEVKGTGRYVVAWDSVHKSGRRYEKLGGTLQDLPTEFVERLRTEKAQRVSAGLVDATPRALERLEAWLSEFPDAEEQADGDWVMRCPAHNDHDPSLVVTASDNRLMVYCRAKCHVEDIVEAIGWEMRDLWAAPELGQKAAPERIKVPLGTAVDLGTRFKAAELMAANLPPVAWAVPDLLPDGLALLAGPPKLGKSWLVLDIAVSVALGRPVLGRPVDQGDVLYLALEDNARRLQGRTGKLLAGATPPAGLELWTRAGTLTSGLIPEIEEWIDRVDRPRVVIIDTLGRVQEGSAWVDAKDGGYADAVAALAGLQDLAAERHIAVVVITHTKKGGWGKDQDPLEAVLGSQGYAGTADAILVLKRERGHADGELFVTGREIDEELTEAVWFDRDSCRWIAGDQDYPTLEDQVLDFLEARDKKGEYEYAWTLTYEGIASALHRRLADVKEAIEALESAGQVSSKPRPGRGRPGKLWGPAAQLPPGLAS